MTAADTPLSPEALLAHREWVRALARSLVRDEHVADDLAQDAWLAALTQPPQRPGAVRGWFRRVISNAAQNHQRGDSRRTRRETVVAAGRGDAAPATDLVARTASHRAAVDAVLSLSEPYRTAILLRYFEDLPVADVATRMGAPLETTRARLRRARERLRERLDAAHAGDRRAWCVALLAPGASSAPPSGRASPASLATGALVMKTWHAVAALVFVLLATLLWTSSANTESTSSETAAAPAADAAATNGSAAAATKARTAEVRTERPRAAPDGAATASEPPAEGVQETTAVPAHPTDYPGWDLSGRVVDTDGNPVAGASVDIGGQRPRSRRGFGLTKVDEDGRFSLRIPHPPEDDAPNAKKAKKTKQKGGGAPAVYVWASAPGYSRTQVRADSRVRSVVLRLDRAAAVDVSLRDWDGTALAAHPVRVFVLGRLRPYLDQEAETDASGHVRFEGMPIGASVVAAAYRGNPIEVTEGTGTVTADGVRIDVRFARRDRLWITARADGELPPIGSVEVDTGDAADRPITWPGGPAAQITVPSGTKRLRLVTVAGAGEWAEVPPDGADRIELRVPARPLREVVIDPGARPTEHARVVGFRMAADRTEWLGAIPLEALLVDGEYRLPIVDGAQLAVTGGPLADLITSASPSRIVLGEPPVRVTTRVVLLPDTARFEAAEANARTAVSGSGFFQERPTAALSDDGALDLELIPGLAYDITVRARGHATKTLRHTPGQEAETVEVTLTPAATLRIRWSGMDSGTRIHAAAFPQLTKIAHEIERGATIAIDPPASGWALVACETGAFLLSAAAGGETPTDIPTFDPIPFTVAPEVPKDARTLLVGMREIAPGVHPIIAVGWPTKPPAGRYVPVLVDPEGIVVHAPQTFDAEHARFALPDVAADAWVRGTWDGARAGTLNVVLRDRDGKETLLPVAALPRGAPTTWRAVDMELRAVATD